MSSSFSIYRVIGGVPHWVETLSSLERAIKRVRDLREQSPGEYVIFDTLTKNVISVAPDKADSKPNALKKGDFK